MKKFLRKISVYSALLASLAEAAYGSAISIGMRGPTIYQPDNRFTVSENGGKKTYTINTIHKLWTGRELGLWGGIDIPFVRNSLGYAKSDIRVFAGPRITAEVEKSGHVHALPYVDVTFPTGRKGFGDRKDLGFGLPVTFLTKGKKVEIDAVAQYKITGRKRPNEVSAAILAGGGNKRLRAIGGFVASANGESRVIYARGILRWTEKYNTYHLEGAYSHPVDRKNSKSGPNASLFFRYNVGRIKK